jgi:hypothetical protein
MFHIGNTNKCLVTGLIIFLFLFGFIFSPLPVLAMPQTASVDFGGHLTAKGLPADWNLKVHEGQAQAGLVSEDGERVLHMKSLSSSFSLERDMTVDVRNYPYLVWSWKAVALPPRGDVRKKSADDQALQLLVGFKDGRVLSYVWDSNAPKGTVVDESVPWPFSIKIKVLVVRSGDGDLGRWVTTRRNVYRDYKELFGKEPPEVERIRLQMNTQYTGDVAEGFMRDILFTRSLS